MNLKAFNSYLTTDIPDGILFYKEKIYKVCPKVNKIIKLNKTFFIFVEDGRIYMTYKCLSQENERFLINNYKKRISLVPFAYFLRRYVKQIGKHDLWYSTIDELKTEFPFFKHLITDISDSKFVDDNLEVIEQTITLLSGEIYKLTFVDSSPLEMEEPMYCLLDIIYFFPNIWIKKVG